MSPAAARSSAPARSRRPSRTATPALFATGAFTLNPSLHSKLPYDTLKDFTPVTLVASGPHVLTVHPSVPAKDVNELVALVRANPGKYSFASSGANTQPRLVGELFKLKFGLDLVHVPFNGGGPAMTSTIGGHTPIAFTSLGNAAPSIKDGKLRALALTSAQRLAEFPDVPTMAEAGRAGAGHRLHAGRRASGPDAQGLSSTAGTREVAKIVALPDVRDRLIGLGLEPVANTPAGVRGLDQGGDREVGRSDAGGQGRQDSKCNSEPRSFDAHRRHPRNRDPAEVRSAQFELRFLRDDHVGGRGHHRRHARRQAGRGLRLQLHRPLRLRRADARALHPAHPEGRSEVAARTRPATISIRKKSSP